MRSNNCNLLLLLILKKNTRAIIQTQHSDVLQLNQCVNFQNSNYTSHKSKYEAPEGKSSLENNGMSEEVCF